FVYDCTELISVARVDTTPPATETLDWPPPLGVVVQAELRAVPVNSSESTAANWTSPPEALVTMVPFSVPALKSADEVWVQWPTPVVNVQVTSLPSEFPLVSVILPDTVTWYCVFA